ncbi:MAG: CTP synthase [Erysipelotrichaceae bacterium]|nr:CTP synthase [Erysipelotrichaceae bacterium]
MTKYIFVTGGVVSGLGKGITAASLGSLLKAKGLKVAALKFDPYMNVDPGTMSPYQHGEVFVTDDGAETDLDLGHYERFIDENLNKYSNLTSGRVYWSVLNKERNGEYLGQTVQIIPHITNEIKDFIAKAIEASQPDVLITEIGGTIGDIESQPFLEAIRQTTIEVGRANCLFIHVTLIPYLSFSQEHKSKPTQHSVKEMQSMGINPDIIIARCDQHISMDVINKIAMFSNIDSDCVIENITLPSLYEAPLMLHDNGLDRVVSRKLNLTTAEPDLSQWLRLADNIKQSTKVVQIALVGKYVKLHDAYLSVAEALVHAGFQQRLKVKITWIDSEDVTRSNVAEKLQGIDGVIVPGGFGSRGIEGMIEACRYTRENDLPYLGICLGMQIAVIEFARNVCGMKNANSGEFSIDNPYNVIDLMPDQLGNIPKGGTMRLGSYPCYIEKNTMMYEAYAQDVISERHRHRYEFNNKFREAMVEKGLIISGTSLNKVIVETIELPNKKFFVGVQFHPEFKSRPNHAHPLFFELVKSAGANVK